MTDIVKQDIIEKKIFLIRNKKVMLDSDLALLYEVSTGRFNEQVKRNVKRFPDDFMVQLSKEEYHSLRSQFATLKRGQHRKYLPYAFTEQGVAMLSSVLNSERAIQVNIGIMRVFVNIRKVVSANKEMLNRLNQLEDKFDKGIKTIFEIIRKPLGSKLLSPKEPFSNKKTIRDIICSCEEYVYWIDKYFSKAGMDWLLELLNTKKVKLVKILMTPEKADEKFISLYNDLKEEFKNNGIKCDLRFITDKNLKADIHDRWIISKDLCYNIPSTDTVMRGQYSEVKRTTNFPPFNDWWRKSKDV